MFRKCHCHNKATLQDTILCYIMRISKKQWYDGIRQTYACENSHSVSSTQLFATRHDVEFSKFSPSGAIAHWNVVGLAIKRSRVRTQAVYFFFVGKMTWFLKKLVWAQKNYLFCPIHIPLCALELSHPFWSHSVGSWSSNSHTCSKSQW